VGRKTAAGDAPRVLFLASTMRRGGAERIVAETAVGLREKHGFETSMVCLRDEGPLGRELRERGVRTVSNVIPARVDPVGAFRLRAVMAAERPDVLYMLDHRNASLYGVLASLAAGVKRRVMAVHTMGLHGGGRSVPLSVRMLLPWIDSVITVAKGQQRYLNEREGIPLGKMAYVPNGVDVERFRPPSGEGERREARDALGVAGTGPVVATLSVLRPEKGHEIFLEAAAAVAAAHPQAIFAVMGEGPEREKLRRRAEALGIGSRVRFAGWVADPALALRGVDVVVFSSRPVVETAPLAGLEAMAAGVPVVATDVGALREIVEHGVSGLLVPPGDAPALARAVQELLADADLRRAMGERARAAVVERYKLESSVAASADLLRKLARGEGVGA